MGESGLLPSPCATDLLNYQGLIQWGGPEGPWPPQLTQNAPDFGPNALQIWAKCPNLHQSAPRIWAKCPSFVTKVPWFCSGTAPNAPFRVQIFKFSDPPNIVLHFESSTRMLNERPNVRAVMCPLISLAPPARIFWISPWTIAQ